MLGNEVYTKFTPSLVSMKLTSPVSAQQSCVPDPCSAASSPASVSLSGSLKDIYNRIPTILPGTVHIS